MGKSHLQLEKARKKRALIAHTAAHVNLQMLKRRIKNDFNLLLNEDVLLEIAEEIYNLRIGKRGKRKGRGVRNS